MMNGSRSLRLMPANARRTGNPSPSKPRGAVVTETTGRGTVVVGSGRSTLGRARTFSTVTAGIGSSSGARGEPRRSEQSLQQQVFHPARNGSGELVQGEGDREAERRQDARPASSV